MKIIGHRGARGLAPENTIASLQKGLEHHADELEFDVRVTKDQIAILHHDSHLIDPNGQKHLIADHTYQELKQHKTDLPTFAETLSSIGAQVTLYIEVKPGEAVPIIARVLGDFISSAPASKTVLLGSKSQKTLRQLHEALPEIPKIVIEPWSGIRARWRARQVKTKFLSMNQRWLWPGFIRAVSSRDYKLYAYTLNNPAKARRWAKAGLYAVVTDYPDRFEN